MKQKIKEFDIDNVEDGANPELTTKYLYPPGNGVLEIDQPDLAIAKASYFSNTVKAFIKIHSETKKLFNPRIDSLEEINRNTRVSAWKFVEVSVHAYDLYERYLDTGNDYLLTQATIACR